MAVGGSTGVFSIMGQVSELLGDTMVHAGGGGEVAIGWSSPGQSRRWLPLCSAASLEGAVPIGAHSDVDDPRGSCKSHKRKRRVP